MALGQDVVNLSDYNVHYYSVKLHILAVSVWHKERKLYWKSMQQGPIHAKRQWLATSDTAYRLPSRFGIEPNLASPSSDIICRLSLDVTSIIDNNVCHSSSRYTSHLQLSVNLP